jgi:hypothetical protein
MLRAAQRDAGAKMTGFEGRDECDGVKNETKTTIAEK